MAALEKKVSIFTIVLLQYRKSTDNAWVNYIDERIPVEATDFVVKDLEPDTVYRVKLAAKNKYGQSEFDVFPKADEQASLGPVQTLTWSPTAFVPVVGLKGLTWNSISIGWDAPPTLDEGEEGKERNYLEYIHYYKLIRKSDSDTVRRHRYVHILNIPTTYTFTPFSVSSLFQHSFILL